MMCDTYVLSLIVFIVINQLNSVVSLIKIYVLRLFVVIYKDTILCVLSEILVGEN